MIEQDITKVVLEAAYKVHSALGPGLLESAYKMCMAYELRKKGYKVEVEKVLPLVYEDIYLEYGYRMDLVVNDKVVVELKCVDCFNDVHIAQLLTYLRLAEKRVGLLLNFKVKSLRDGVKRVVL
jgi:GxxExxY protein